LISEAPESAGRPRRSTAWIYSKRVVDWGIRPKAGGREGTVVPKRPAENWELSRRTIPRRFGGHDCLFCGYEELLSMKQAAGRRQDEIAIKGLKAARGEL